MISFCDRKDRERWGCPFLSLLMGIILLTAGCSPPTPLAEPTSTHASLPTATESSRSPTPTTPPTPTATATTMPTPSAPMGRGPFLIYADSQGDIVVVDADGESVRTLALPEGAAVGELAEAVSPDGRWLAFHTGSMGESGADQAGPFDLTLNLLDLSDGQVQRITPLLSDDYPDNFQQLASMLDQQGVTPVPGADLSAVPAFLRDAFVYGIDALAWSPDGRYLAFAGQMDGPSSDLYVCEVETLVIRRLSDGLEQIQTIAWSPDGAWILHGSAHVVGAGSAVHYHAAAADGSTVKTLSSSILDIWGWLSSSTYLQSQATNGPAGTFNLESVDIESETISTLWEGSFLSFAVDPARDVLAIVGFEALRQGNAPAALFLVDLTNGSVRQVAESMSSVAFVGTFNKRFIATGGDGTWFVLADGTLEETGWGTDQAVVSPDTRFTAVLGDRLEIYGWGDLLVNEIELPWPARSIDRVLWQPGSPGLFFTIDSEVYWISLVEGTARPVDQNVPMGQGLNATFSRPADVGPETVWDASAQALADFADCHFESPTPLECVAAVMEADGASQQAVQFTALLGGEGYMSAFAEHGRVDLTQITWLPRTSDRMQWAVVNGAPRIIFASEDLGDIDIALDPRYTTLVEQYPELTIWESLNYFEYEEPLQPGGQRFVFSYDLVDGCHLCRTGALALVGFDFDGAGQFLGPELLYLQE